MGFVGLVAVPLVSRYLACRRYVHGFTDPCSEKLLPDLPPHLQNITYTLVLDLDETIICSDWLRKRGWRTFKRPGVDEFIDRMGQMYELVVYTPTLFTYANPILDRLDPKGYIPQTHRLYRDANQMKHILIKESPEGFCTSCGQKSWIGNTLSGCSGCTSPNWRKGIHIG